MSVPVHMCKAERSQGLALLEGEGEAVTLPPLQVIHPPQTELALGLTPARQCPFCDVWLPPGASLRDHCDPRPARPGVVVLAALRLQGEGYGNDEG